MGGIELSKIIDEPDFRNKIGVFVDRFHAGELLSDKLLHYANRNDVYILAIPAGGIQVAVVVAKRLNLPLDLVITRKIHVPWNKEAGFGAISWNGLVLVNEPLVASLGLSDDDVSRCVAKEKEIIKRRVKSFRGTKPFPDLSNKNIIVIDDGLASGFSMLTTIKAVKRNKVNEIIIAVPTASISAINLLKSHVNQIICLNIRSDVFFAVANAYKNWYDLNDKDVIELLKHVTRKY
jgi:putative phosphoribosyl transferase